jgi:hypothetical protein
VFKTQDSLSRLLSPSLKVQVDQGKIMNMMSLSIRCSCADEDWMGAERMTTPVTRLARIEILNLDIDCVTHTERQRKQ